MAYVYHADREYIDLTSCTFVNYTKDSYEFAACYINTNIQFLPEIVKGTGVIHLDKKGW